MAQGKKWEGSPTWSQPRWGGGWARLTRAKEGCDWRRFLGSREQTQPHRVTSFCELCTCNGLIWNLGFRSIHWSYDQNNFSKMSGVIYSCFSQFLASIFIWDALLLFTLSSRIPWSTQSDKPWDGIKISGYRHSPRVPKFTLEVDFLNELQAWQDQIERFQGLAENWIPATAEG